MILPRGESQYDDHIKLFYACALSDMDTMGGGCYFKNPIHLGRILFT